MRNSSLDEISAFESTRMNFTAAEEHKMREQKVNVKIKNIGLAGTEHGGHPRVSIAKQSKYSQGARSPLVT